MPHVNRERKGPRACLLSACHLCLPLVFMATSQMVTSVGGTAEPLPGSPYSVSASCYSWHCDPAVDWCKGGHGSLLPSTGQLHSTCLCSDLNVPVLGLQHSAAVSWVRHRVTAFFPHPGSHKDGPHLPVCSAEPLVPGCSRGPSCAWICQCG